MEKPRGEDSKGMVLWALYWSFFEVTLKENKSKEDRKTLPDSRLKVVC